MLLAAPLVLGAALLLARLHPTLARLFLSEDHVFEWLQFAAFLVAGVVGGGVAARLAASRRWWGSAAWATFGLGLLLVAGEEIAWGQRVLGFETPEGLDEVNRQGETTMHNISGAGVFTSAGLTLVAIAGSVGVLLLVVLGSEATRRRLAVLSPPLVLVPLFSAMVAVKAFRAAHTLLDGPGGSDITEYGELCFALALAGFAVIRWGELARSDEVAPVPARVSRDGGSRGPDMIGDTAPSAAPGAARP